MSNIDARILEVNRQIHEWRKADEQGKRKARARLEAATPIICQRCHKAFDVSVNVRETVYDYLELNGRFMSGLVCEPCKEAARQEHRRQEEERHEHEREAAAEAERKRLADIRDNLPRYLIRVGVPNVLAAARLDNCPDLPPELVQHVRLWVAGPQGFLVFTGPPGCGKSYLATCALGEVLMAGQYRPEHVKFLSEPAWLESVKLNYGNPVADSTPFHVPMLVFDDLGAGYWNDLRRAEIERLLRSRYDSQKPTIITSNLDAKDIGERLGGRVLSVLRSAGKIVKFPTKDLRTAGSVKPQRLGTDGDGTPGAGVF